MGSSVYFFWSSPKTSNKFRLFSRESSVDVRCSVPVLWWSAPASQTMSGGTGPPDLLRGKRISPCPTSQRESLFLQKLAHEEKEGSGSKVLEGVPRLCKKPVSSDRDVPTNPADWHAKRRHSFRNWTCELKASERKLEWWKIQVWHDWAPTCLGTAHVYGIVCACVYGVCVCIHSRW